jgi:hypothetical protein
MKAIQVNSEVKLTTGISIPAGAVFSVSTAQVFRSVAGLVPIKITPALHASLSALEDGLSAIDTATVIRLKNAQFIFKVPVEDYESRTAEDLFLDSLFILLSDYFGNDCAMVNAPDEKPADIAISAGDILGVPGSNSAPERAEEPKKSIIQRIFGS